MDMINNKKGPFKPDEDFDISPMKEKSRSPKKIKTNRDVVNPKHEELANYISKNHEERKAMQDL